MPVMTAGNDLGRRDVVATGAMDSGDAYVVEQVLDGSRTLRRLLFRSNPRSIQTEVAISKVKPPKSKNSKKTGKAKTQWRVDGADVRSAYHRAILAAVASSFRPSAASSSRPRPLRSRSVASKAWGGQRKGSAAALPRLPSSKAPMRLPRPKTEAC